MEFNESRELEKKAKNRTKRFLILGLAIWMGFLFFFLNQSRHEHSLIFAQILPKGLDTVAPVKIITVDDTTDIDPNVNPIQVVVDTADYVDTTVNTENKFSLKIYAPEVGNQGNLGSCVSWATAYSAFTIVRRIEEGNNTLESYSPLNLYIRYKKLFKESPCDDGAVIELALNILKRKGCSLFRNFRNKCTTTVSQDEEYRDKLFSFDQIEPSEIETIKKAISSKMPLVIGVECYENDWSNAVLDNGLWSGFYSGGRTGGHAMCVIGYDDKKGGGAFEIMNSWGADWGQKGFFWMKYEDFMKHVHSCFILVPKSKKKIK
jgi:C1A family cysteine protease